jgi:Ca2+-binding RTX toxin-like protein
MRARDRTIRTRGLGSCLGFALAMACAALLSAPALAATNLAVVGNTLTADSGSGRGQSQGKGKGKGKQKDKGPKEANGISVAHLGGHYFVSDLAGVTTNDPACTDFGSSAACPDTGIIAVRVSSGKGSDTISIAGTLPAVFVSLNGEDGEDTLIGADDPSGEILSGGKGNDRMFGGTGPDFFNGDQGFDTVAYGDHSAGVTVTIGSPFNDGNAADAGAGGVLDSVTGTVERVKGTAFDDVLKGDRGENALIGKGGNDLLKGKKGRDRLKGKAGIDLLKAKDGTRDRGINCGKGNNRKERAKFDKRLDPRPKSC